MRLRVFLLLIFLLVLGTAPTLADDGGDELIPIMPDNVDQVEQLRVLSEIKAWDAAWSPSGGQLAVGTLDGVQLCYCETFQNPQMLDNFKGVNAYRVAWSSDGTLLAAGTAGSPAQVIVQDMSTNQSWSVDVEADVLSLDFSPNDSLLAVGLARNKGVRVLSTVDGSEFTRFSADTPVETLAFTPSGTELLYPAAREMLRRQPLNEQSALEIPVACTITDLRVSSNGGQPRVLISTFDCCVNMIDLDTGAVLYKTVCGQAFALDFNTDGSLFMTGNQDGTIHFLDSADGANLATLAAHKDEVIRLDVHPDGTRIVTVSLDDTVRVFGIPKQSVAVPCDVAEIPEGVPVGEILYHAQPTTGGPGAIYHVLAWCGEHTRMLDGALYPAWSPDGSQLAFQYVNPDTGQLDGLWLAEADGTNLRPVPNSLPRDRAPSWSPDGNALVFESFREGNSGLYTVDLASETVVPLLVSADAAYEQPVWSPDGETIAYLMRATTMQGEVRYLYVVNADGSEPRRLSDLTYVTSVAWSPDGTQLVLAAEQTAFTANIIVLDMTNGDTTVLTEGAVDTQPVWSPDQRHIAFVRGDALMIVPVDGSEDPHPVVRLADTYGSTGLSWKALETD